MVWFLQDLEQQIDADQIAAPQLLPGINLDEAIAEKKKGRRLYNSDVNQPERETQVDAFDLHEKNKSQLLFREREVDNIQNLIYATESTEDIYDEKVIDSNRYTAPKVKLEMFKRPTVKRLLKKRFVTGQTSDQIVKNLLNMSDSEDEAGLEDGKKIDKEQLRRIEENDHKTSKADKKKKRLENIGIKAEQSGSEFEEEKEDDEEQKDGKDSKGKKEEVFPDHKPLK